MPAGVIREWLRQLQELVKHWTQNRDLNYKELDFSDAYFEQAYPNHWLVDDDSEFNGIYKKIHVRVVKTKNVSEDDINY